MHFSRRIFLANTQPLCNLHSKGLQEKTAHPVMQVMREGTDVTLVAFGKLVGYNLKVAEELEKEGISCEVATDLCTSAACPGTWSL